MLFDGALYPTALETLMERFGREDEIVSARLGAVFNTSPMKGLEPTSLETFHAVLHSAVTVLNSMGFSGDLNSTENLRRVIQKLPIELRREWGREVIKMEPERLNLMKFNSWLGLQVRIAIAVPTQPHDRGMVRALPEPARRASRAPRTHSTSVAMTTAPAIDTERAAHREQDRRDEPRCCCGEFHDLPSCPSFLQRTPNDRAKFVAESGRCFLCLQFDHRSRQCRSQRRCEEHGCRGRHHPVLHGSERIIPRSTRTEERSNRTVAAASALRSTTLLQIVPIRVHGPESCIDTFAALDSGAQTSLCTEKLAKQLKLSGQTAPLCLNNVEGSEPKRIALKTTLKLSPLARDSESTQVSVNEVWTVPALNIPAPQINQSVRSK